jgi:hypothetical protein
MHDPVHRRENKGRDECGNEPRDREAVQMHKRRNAPDEKRVHDEGEESERDEIQREREEEDDGAYEKIDYTEDEGDFDGGVEIRNREPGHKARNEKKRENRRKESDEKFHPITIAFGTKKRGEFLFEYSPALRKELFGFLKLHFFGFRAIGYFHNVVPPPLPCSP